MHIKYDEKQRILIHFYDEPKERYIDEVVRVRTENWRLKVFYIARDNKEHHHTFSRKFVKSWEVIPFNEPKKTPVEPKNDPVEPQEIKKKESYRLHKKGLI